MSDILNVASALLPSPGEEGKSVLLTSIQSGEGKTTMLNHIAYSSASLLGMPILISDISSYDNGERNVNRGGVSLSLDVNQAERNKSSSHLEGVSSQELNVVQESSVLRSTAHPNIQRLEANIEGNPYKFLQTWLAQNRHNFGLLFFEAPAVYGHKSPDPILLSALFDQILLVYQPHQTPLDKAKETLKALHHGSAGRPTSVVLNYGPENIKKERTSFLKMMTGLVFKPVKKKKVAKTKPRKPSKPRLSRTSENSDDWWEENF